MSNFVIYQDQENFQERETTVVLDAKKNRPKLAPLVINKENAIENQVRNNICRFLFVLIFLASCVVLVRFSRLKSRVQHRQPSLLERLSRNQLWFQRMNQSQSRKFMSRRCLSRTIRSSMLPVRNGQAMC